MALPHKPSEDDTLSGASDSRIFPRTSESTYRATDSNAGPHAENLAELNTASFTSAVLKRSGDFSENDELLKRAKTEATPNAGLERQEHVPGQEQSPGSLPGSILPRPVASSDSSSGAENRTTPESPATTQHRAPSASEKARTTSAKASDTIKSHSQTSQIVSSTTPGKTPSEPRAYFKTGGEAYNLVYLDELREFTGRLYKDQFDEALTIVMAALEEKGLNFRKSELEGLEPHHRFQIERDTLESMKPGWSKTIELEIAAIFRSAMRVAGMCADLPLLPGAQATVVTLETLARWQQTLAQAHISRNAVDPKWVVGDTAIARHSKPFCHFESISVEVSNDWRTLRDGKHHDYLFHPLCKIVIKKQLKIGILHHDLSIKCREITSCHGEGPIKYKDAQEHIRSEYKMIVGKTSRYPDQLSREMAHA